MIGNLGPYLNYKFSGVEQLGKVPTHWEIRRLRNVADIRASNVDKHVKEDEIPIRLCNYVDVYKNNCISQNINFMRVTATREEIDRFHLEEDDVILTKDSVAWSGIGVPSLVSQSAPDLILGYHLALLRTYKHELIGGYLFYALNSKGLSYQFHRETKGVTIYGLSHASIKSIRLPLPPLSEQTAIVRYLDYVDYRIRKYIRVKQKLIGLLKEQRQAIIHNAVTRGLDPNAPLKDSGVEWLGKVPAHWEIRRLRNVADIRASNVDKHVKEDEIPIRLCNYVDVYKNNCISQNINFMRVTATREEIDRFHLEEDDVILTKDSVAWSGIGVPSLVSQSAPDLILGYHLALLRTYKHELIGGYLFYALNSKGLSYQFHRETKGVTIYHLSHAGIKSARLPLPPLSEQTAIVEYLDKATAAIDTTISRAHREIKLLREYHTRLVTDVVTGKVDVRGVVANLPDEPQHDKSFIDINNVMDDNGGAVEEPDALPEEIEA